MNFLRILSFVIPVILKKIITPKRLVLLFLLGFLCYSLYTYISPLPSPPPSESSCPEFPKDGFHWNANALANWRYVKDHAGYNGCTGLIYVNSEPFKNKCGKQFSSGEVFLFPGTYCTDNCTRCPNVEDRPSIDCRTTCPLNNAKISATLHQQLTDVLTKRTADFMGFSIKLDGDINSRGVSYNSATCNPQWFEDKEIGQCNNIDWQHELSKFLEGNLR